MTAPACALCAETRSQVLFAATAEVRGQPRTYRLRRCTGCGLVHTEPWPSPEELAQIYSRDYWGRTRPQDPAWLQREHRERLAFLHRFRRQGRLLDVGCGLGLFLLALDPASWDRYGLEPMPEPRAAAGRGLGLDHVFAAELGSQGLAGERFDVITFWDVLEHLPDPRGALEAAGRLLRPGGVVLLSLPNFSSYQARHFREDWYALRLPGHLHHFTPATLGRLLEAAGLRLRTLDDRFHRENYHHLKHSLLARLTRRYGPAGRLPYYFLKPLFHPWERLSTWWGGGSHLLAAAEPAPGPRA